MCWLRAYVCVYEKGNSVDGNIGARARAAYDGNGKKTGQDSHSNGDDGGGGDSDRQHTVLFYSVFSLFCGYFFFFVWFSNPIKWWGKAFLKQNN